MSCTRVPKQCFYNLQVTIILMMIMDHYKIKQMWGERIDENECWYCGRMRQGEFIRHPAAQAILGLIWPAQGASPMPCTHTGM